MPAGLVTFLLSHWRAMGMILVAGLLGVYIAVLRDDVERAYERLDLVTARAAAFKAQTQAASADYERRRAAREAQDKRDKEVADARYKASLAAAHARADELRRERDAADRRFLAERPADSRCPEGQVCFDGPGFRAAYGRLLQCVRAGADRCAALEQALENAIEWANP